MGELCLLRVPPVEFAGLIKFYPPGDGRKSVHVQAGGIDFLFFYPVTFLKVSVSLYGL